MQLLAQSVVQHRAKFGFVTLVIDLWFGDDQLFGEGGHPQPLINVLGSVRPVDQIADATFRR